VNRVIPARLTHTSSLITAALVAAVAVTAIVSSVAGVIVARGVIYESSRVAILTQFQFASNEIFDRLGDDPSPAAFEAQALYLPSETLIVDLTSDTIYGELDPNVVPSELVAELRGPEPTQSFLYGTIGSRDALFIGRAESNVVVVTAWLFDAEQDYVDRLIVMGITIVTSALVSAAIVGWLLGRRLALPLRRLATMADGIGAGKSTQNFHSGFSDLNDIGKTLVESSRQLQHTITELTRREGHSRRLVSDVAHELRTPLTSMVAVSEILDDVDTATADERKLAVDMIRSGTARLTFLVDELLEQSRIEGGTARLSKREAPLGEVIEAAKNLLGNDTDIEVRCIDGAMITTDIDRLTKILSNLMRNAVRYGRPPLSMVVAAEDSAYEITMRDHGPGIPVADLDRIFLPFVVLDASRGDPESTGLGLAIARETARLLGGDLVAERRGTGTAFVLTIPKRPRR
jgi:two-component system sensor histidine kinase MtrB